MVMVRMETIQAGQRILAESVAQALIHLKHSWKVYSLSRALTQALKDSREASRWPGDRLQVGTLMSRRVEVITRLLQRETVAYPGKLAAGLPCLPDPACHLRLPDPVKAENDGDTPDLPVCRRRSGAKEGQDGRWPLAAVTRGAAPCRGRTGVRR
jgi:hypothetical protein